MGKVLGNDLDGIVLQKNTPANDMRIHPEEMFEAGNSPKTIAQKINFPHLSENEIQEQEVVRKQSS